MCKITKKDFYLEIIHQLLLSLQSFVKISEMDGKIEVDLLTSAEIREIAPRLEMSQFCIGVVLVHLFSHILCQGAVIEDINNGDHQIVNILRFNMLRLSSQGESGGELFLTECLKPLHDKSRRIQDFWVL